MPDIDRTDLLVLFGHNPMASNGSIWTVPDFPARRRELASRGGRFVVVDPRRTETAKVADEHHFVRPGTDVWVLLAMLREVLALGAGNAQRPINAIPSQAVAHCQLRFVVGTDWKNVQATLRQHLDAHGLEQVDITMGMMCGATRLDLDNPWVDWTLASMERSAGQSATLLPNLAGSLPNDIFADQLGLPTLWVPHSYPACAQHAPNEHLLAPVAREGLAVMAGLFWDLGEPQGTPWTEGRTARQEATA